MNYSFNLKPDQTSYAAKKEFINQLQSAITDKLNNGNLLKFALQYGFTLENAYKAVQGAIDSNELDVNLIDDDVLHITHRSHFKKELTEQQKAEFDEVVNQEIKRLEDEYRRVNDTTKPEKVVAEAQSTIEQEVKPNNSKILPRPRMRMT